MAMIDTVLREIRRRARLAGSLRALAREWDICPGHLSRVTRKQKNPGPDVLKHLGLRELVTYVADEKERL
jgi:hypothetical protein